jgi:small nuclear ribonucleoprotein (snRNP)-like protein
MTLIISFVLASQLVELKNGETYNGNLVTCDTWMNMHMNEVICTSKVAMLPVAGGGEWSLCSTAVRMS